MEKMRILLGFLIFIFGIILNYKEEGIMISGLRPLKLLS